MKKHYAIQYKIHPKNHQTYQKIWITGFYYGYDKKNMKFEKRTNIAFVESRTQCLIWKIPMQSNARSIMKVTKPTKEIWKLLDFIMGMTIKCEIWRKKIPMQSNLKITKPTEEIYDNKKTIIALVESRTQDLPLTKRVL